MEKKTERGITWDEVDEKLKVDYVEILASLAYIDNDFDIKERQYIVDTLEKTGISEAHQERILRKFVEKPDIEIIQKKISEFSNSPLKFSLLTDLMTMAKADGKVTTSENEFISFAVKNLNFTEKQLGAIIIYINKMEDLKREMDKDERHAKVQRIMAPLVTIGIPILLSATMGWSLGILSFGAWAGYSGLSAIKMVNSGKSDKDLISKI